MKTWRVWSIVVVLFTALWVPACNNDDDENARLKVLLTDSPGNYEEVNIDIQDVQINRTTASGSGWESIDLEQKGVYNLLDLTNGLDTLLGSLLLPAGNLAQIRLVLGTANSVKVDGEVYDLATPSAQQSGLKININQTLLEGITYELVLDFDVARSVVERGNNTYLLKPTIRSFVEATCGAVKGSILPIVAMPTVYALEGTDTIGSTLPDELGHFMLRGIPPGVYTITFDPVTGYAQKTIDDVSVAAGIATNLGTVNIDQE